MVRTSFLTIQFFSVYYPYLISHLNKHIILHIFILSWISISRDNLVLRHNYTINKYHIILNCYKFFNPSSYIGFPSISVMVFDLHEILPFQSTSHTEGQAYTFLLRRTSIIKAPHISLPCANVPWPWLPMPLKICTKVSW